MIRFHAPLLFAAQCTILAMLHACGGAPTDEATMPPADAGESPMTEASGDPATPETVAPDAVPESPDDTAAPEAPSADTSDSVVDAGESEAAPVTAEVPPDTKASTTTAKVSKGRAVYTFPGKKGAVTFSHSAHKSVTTCKNCHHDKEKGVAPPACRSCHGKGTGPTFMAVAHKLCKNCHKSQGLPIGCDSCHKK